MRHAARPGSSSTCWALFWPALRAWPVFPQLGGAALFLTGANFKIVLIQTVIVAMGALGMTMIIVSGGIDLSVGSDGGVDQRRRGATLLLKGFSPRRPSCLTILAGGAIGLVNGASLRLFA